MIKIETIGSDPEFGVYDSETGDFVSVVGLLGGTKRKPLDIGEGCARQEDNVMAEFTIPPVKSEDDFLRYINYCKKTGTDILNEKNPNLSIKALSSHFYSPQQLQSRKAKAFGCSESYNAYTGEVNQSPNPGNTGLRSAGFHVHVGYKGSIEDDTVFRNIIKAMDIYLGLGSVIIDLDKERRKLYGQAGEFRVRQINEFVVVEYRSLGGNLLGSDNLIRWVYQNTHRAVDFLNRGGDLNKYQDEVIEAINTSNDVLAHKLIEKFNVPVPKLQVLNENIVKYA